MAQELATSFPVLGSRVIVWVSFDSEVTKEAREVRLRMVLILDGSKGDVLEHGISEALVVHDAVQGQGEVGKALDK